MRSSTFSSSTYIFAVLAIVVAGLAGIELAVRKMPSVYCKAELDQLYGCSNFRPIKHYLGGTTDRVLLGDSRLEYMVDYKGFEDYSIPALVPSEILKVTEYLTSTRQINHALIGIGAHYFQDKTRTRTWDVIPDTTFDRQLFPWPVFAFEPALTSGLRQYLWDSAFNRKLPTVAGRKMLTDKGLDEHDRLRQQANRAKGEASGLEKLWWQEYPLVLEPHKWELSSQRARNERAGRRFRFFYPRQNYRNIDEHDSLVALFDLIDEKGIDACFFSFPYAEEFLAAVENPKYPLYREVEIYIRELVEARGFRYIDADELDFGLTTHHFRDGDHLLKPVIEALTPAVVDSCFPDIPAK